MLCQDKLLKELELLVDSLKNGNFSSYDEITCKMKNSTITLQLKKQYAFLKLIIDRDKDKINGFLQICLDKCQFLIHVIKNIVKINNNIVKDDNITKKLITIAEDLLELDKEKLIQILKNNFNITEEQIIHAKKVMYNEFV